MQKKSNQGNCLRFSGAIVDDIIPSHSFHETENREVLYLSSSLLEPSLSVAFLPSQQLLQQQRSAEGREGGSQRRLSCASQVRQYCTYLYSAVS